MEYSTTFSAVPGNFRKKRKKFLTNQIAYLKSCCASTQKESLEKTASPSFISSTHALSMDSSQSYLQTKKRRQSTDDEIISNEQDE